MAGNVDSLGRGLELPANWQVDAGPKGIGKGAAGVAADAGTDGTGFTEHDAAQLGGGSPMLALEGGVSVDPKLSACLPEPDPGLLKTPAGAQSVQTPDGRAYFETDGTRITGGQLKLPQGLTLILEHGKDGYQVKIADGDGPGRRLSECGGMGAMLGKEAMTGLRDFVAANGHDPLSQAFARACVETLRRDIQPKP